MLETWSLNKLKASEKGEEYLPQHTCCEVWDSPRFARYQEPNFCSSERRVRRNPACCSPKDISNINFDIKRYKWNLCHSLKPNFPKAAYKIYELFTSTGEANFTAKCGFGACVPGKWVLNARSASLRWYLDGRVGEISRSIFKCHTLFFSSTVNFLHLSRRNICRLSDNLQNFMPCFLKRSSWES